MSDFGTAWRDKRIAELEAQVQAQTETIKEARQKAFDDMAEYCRRERRSICGNHQFDIVDDTYKVGRHDALGSLAGFCERGLKEEVSKSEHRVAALEKVYEAAKVEVDRRKTMNPNTADALTLAVEELEKPK